MKYAIGIDIGATNTRIAIVDDQGTVVWKKTVPTVKNDLNGLVTQNSNLINEALEIDKEIIEIGIGIPGPVTPKIGFVHVLPNIGMGNFDIAKILHRRFNLPITVMNDANAAAYGEAICGAGKGYRVVQYITLSTGIGGGLVIGGKVYTGKHGFAQEIGNMIIDPSIDKPNTSMNKGSFESWCSGSSLVRMAKNKGFAPKHAGDVFANPACEDIINEWVNHMGMAISNMITLYEPDVFVIGGGLIKSSHYFFDKIIEATKPYTHDGIKPHIIIKMASLGQDSGVIGAGIMALLNKDIWF